jgi:hypothetical protein
MFFCKNEVHLEDFFENIKHRKDGRVTRAEFKGESMENLGSVRTKMWVCPSCDTILGFSEMA